MANINYVMGILEKIKTLPEYKDNHPTIVLVSNGDVIDYYYDYYLFPWGLAVMLIDPQANVANTEVSLRFISYKALSSVGLNDALDSKINIADIKGYNIVDAEWAKFANGFINDVKTGNNNDTVEYNGWFFACGNWFNVDHVNDFKNDIMDFNSDWIDINGINCKKQRLLLDTKTIDQFTIKARDWFRIKTVNDLVNNTADLKKQIEDYIKCKNINLCPLWKSPNEKGIFELAYEYGDIVKKGSKKYISLTSGNHYDPEDPKFVGMWKESTISIPVIK